MKKLVSKFNKKNAFTLAELLIVVAIIGVLVAVSIPIFTAQLEKSREATDIANLRSAKAEAIAHYLNNDETTKADSDAPGLYVFDAEEGTLLSVTDDAKDYETLTGKTDAGGYGKGTSKDGGCDDFKMDVSSSEETEEESGNDTEYTLSKCEDHPSQYNADVDELRTGYYTGECEVQNQIIAVEIYSDGCILLKWIDSATDVVATTFPTV